MKENFSLKERIISYMRNTLSLDLIAASTVAMVGVPQAMAYAAIVGVNPLYGLYASIIPAIVASFFGSSNHVVTGPTNTIALLTSSVLVSVLGRSDYSEFVFTLAILSGIIRLLLGFFHLVFIIRYVSNSVLTGFHSGAAILIILNQLPQLLGLSSSSGDNLVEVISHIANNFSEINTLVLASGLTCIAFLITMQRFSPRLPVALLIILLTGLIVHFFGWHEKGFWLVADIGAEEVSGLKFHIPSDVWKIKYLAMLLTSASAIAMMSLLEAVSVAKVIAIRTGQRIDANREFIGQGLASIAGGLFHGIPTSGSLTRSSVNYNGGAVTRLASGFSGLLVLIVSVIFKDWIQYIPIVSLGSIVVVSAFRMIDFHHIALTWHGRLVSKVVMGVTFIAVLLLPLQMSIFLGVGLSITFYLIESSHLKLTYLVLNKNGSVIEYEIEEVYKNKLRLAVINVEGPLCFAAAKDLEDQIIKMIDMGVRHIFLRFRRMQMMASTGISTLRLLNRKAREFGGSIVLTGVTNEVYMFLRDCGLEDVLQAENIYLATEKPYESTRIAIAHCLKKT